ncbi:MAG: MFS transporter [Pantoea sp.]|uniref:MFS transporter n=2 Tax=Pantoea septica TaxID=472695 RepID=A0ABX3UQR0_9GAMM|nr:MFS transporter [Pantoea sp.]MDU5779271.1 MFS transporter [Pantoea sp.]ORM98526.1 MFS transporter [Pantoea septica]
MLIRLFAITGGVAVGNLYTAQPLLNDIALSFGAPPDSASMLITFTQLGYATGILLLVPLGDIRNRRRLIPAILFLSALSLCLTAVAPSMPLLMAAMALTGLTTVAGQLLTPFAGDLASPSQLGKVLGTIISGMLIGILLSRTVSGVIADFLGWRAVYFIAAGGALILAFLMLRMLPADVPRQHLSYRELMRSLLSTIAESAAVRITLLIAACGFLVFTLFWTSLTFLLSSAPYSYTVSQIGLTGLAGLAGALMARRAGILHDRGHSVMATGLALLLALVAIGVAAWGRNSLYLIILAIILIDIAVQTLNVLHQTRIISINPAMRSRLSTIFVVSNFIGAAVGSALAGILWHAGGWSAVMTGAAGFLALALAIWFMNRDALKLK